VDAVLAVPMMDEGVEEKLTLLEYILPLFREVSVEEGAECVDPAEWVDPPLFLRLLVE
jgi:hypothetical protein